VVKIAVYAIAKNEEQFVERWYNSAKDADYLFILDTGSTDNTVKIAKDLGINVEIQSFDSWRFDVARNSSLEMIPQDTSMCIALDMDEVLVEGWRVELEKSINDGITRPRYQYTWSWKEDGTPGLIYGGDKIHTRHNYRWKHPVHEVLVCQEEEIQGWYDIKIHHFPDSTKPRSQYLPLLELAVQEDPQDDRNAYYYARELFYYNQYEKASEEFKRHLSLPRAVWKPERSSSMRFLGKIEDSEEWLLKAAAEAPERREPWFDLTMYHYHNKNWIECLTYAERTLSIKEKPLEYLCEESAWGYMPHDFAAIAAYNVGLYKKAREHGENAILLNHTDERLRQNMEWYNKER
jgi:glycosyltransferase involved in cell wall biosynthesis